MPKHFEIIAFDADDTLWHNERLYNLTQDKFAKMLSFYHSEKWINQRLFETEVKNLKIFGYGVKGFTLAMIETAIELTEGRVQGNEIKKIIELSKEMLRAPIDLLPGVAEAIAELSKSYPLMIITKGDLFDQETKIARSGLTRYFKHFEIVSEKDENIYREILKNYRIPPEKFLMVGNSMKSDILPVVALGGKAIFIPYESTWQHEAVQEDIFSQTDYHELASISELPEWLSKQF